MTDLPGPGALPLADKAERDEPTATLGTVEGDALAARDAHGHEGGGDEHDDHGGEDEHGVLAYGLQTGPRTHRVLVYSSDAGVRDRVRGAVGRHPAPDLGRVEWVEATTGKQAVAALDAGGLDLAIFDGEARPTGGLGLSKQLKDEIKDCPPFIVLIARPDDRWLGQWSLADAVVAFPVDAPLLTSVVGQQLRDRASGLPVRRALA
jgi:hypothetical protein